MLSSLCRQFSAIGLVHAKKATAKATTTATTILPAISSGSSSSSLQQFASSSSNTKCFLSTYPSTTTASGDQQAEEFVTVLKLNMLKDNPGAVKKVRSYESPVYLFLGKIWNSTEISPNNPFLFRISYRNVVWDVVSVPRKVKQPDGVIKDKRHVPVDRFR
jgi:hypothetical protein